MNLRDAAHLTSLLSSISSIPSSPRPGPLPRRGGPACPHPVGNLSGTWSGASRGHLPQVTYSFTINTCKSVSKQTTLTPFRMNTYEKQGGGGGSKLTSNEWK